MSTTAKTEEPEIKDDAIYTEGDLTIISADNVRFRLPSFYLLAARSVLCLVCSSGAWSS